MKDFKNYLSPFSFRYGSDQMRQIFSEENKFKLWRKIWVELAKAQAKQGLVSKEQLKDLEDNQSNIDIERIFEIEKETRHDVVAAIKEFAQKTSVGGGKIHLGATSMDIVDNADSVRVKQALEIIENKLIELISEFEKKIEKYANFACIGYTHLQTAQPTTLGYRFALYGQDLLFDLKFLRFVKDQLRAKGLKGAVGTAGSYVKLMGEDGAEKLDRDVMNALAVEPVLIAAQTTPRKIDSIVAKVLVSISESLYKFAFDLRILQSPGFGELQEPFEEKQVGSSAMPFKKNPIKAEQICSLGRLIISLGNVAAENAASQLLERTLDDSANRRIYLPEMFLALDEMLQSSILIIQGLVVNEPRIQENLERFGPFAATEEIIIEAVKNGANRQEIHEILRQVSMEAWSLVSVGEENPMEELLEKEERLLEYLDKKQIKEMLNPQKHLGTAPKRAKELLKEIKKEI